jgi:hypothetical protein
MNDMENKQYINPDQSSYETGDSVSGGFVSKQQIVGMGIIISFVISLILLWKLYSAIVGFAPVRAPRPIDPSVRISASGFGNSENYAKKLPRLKDKGKIEDHHISRFLNIAKAPDMQNARLVTDASGTAAYEVSNYDPSVDSVEDSVRQSHAEWSDNSIIASAGTNSKLMIRDDRESNGVPLVGGFNFRSRYTDVYTDAGARTVDSSYPAQYSDSSNRSMAQAYGASLAGSSNY